MSLVRLTFKIVSLVPMVFIGFQSFASLDCEHPVHKKIAESIPIFRNGYDEKSILKMYRGVKEPQFDHNRMLHFMFHDPYVYSSGQMIEIGSGGSFNLTSGTWKYTKPKNGEADPNPKSFLDRWNQTLAETSRQVEVGKDGLHSIWNQYSYSTYNSQPYYNWVQFISSAYTTSQGYGNFVLGLDIPTARVNPDMRSSDSAFVIPVLVAPWEVSEVTVQDNNSLVIKKKFSEAESGSNRCQVEYLELKSGNSTLGYLSLCPEGDACEQNAAVLSSIYSGTNLIKAISSFDFDHQTISVTKEKPESKGGVCSAKNLYQSMGEFNTAIEKLGEDIRENRVRNLVLNLNRVPELKCLSGLQKNATFWKQLPNISWKQLMILGLGLQDGAVVSRAVNLAIRAESKYETFEDLIRDYAILETAMTQKKFVRELLRLIATAPTAEQSAPGISRLKAMLSES